MGLNPIWSNKKRRSNGRRRESQPLYRKRRSFLMEPLEPRQMLAGGPALQAILPNEGLDLLGSVPQSVTLKTSPTELIFRFTDGQILDSTTLGAIQITRSVDGVFFNGNDEVLLPFDPGRPGFVGLGDRGNEVIVRFPSALPDDLYHINVFGTGAAPLRNIAGEPYNDGGNSLTGFEIDLAPQIVAVVPQPITRSGGL